MTKNNLQKIEQKWQKKWEKDKDLYKAKDSSEKPKKYVLVEFPYPSGYGLHVGHAFTMTGADVYARKQRMDGFNVLFPMGWDAFGLPTENYAIREGISPQKATKDNTDKFRRQAKKLAFSFDWSREVNTTDPDYYKWTQWIFIQLFKHGLAYKEERPVNWCPSCKIGLANEEVVNGTCERCGEVVTKKNLSQWIIKITNYADRLIDGLDKTEFIKKVKAAQVNWIGRKEGTNVKFSVVDMDEISVFTTRIDTIFGVTGVVLAPEHPLTASLLSSKSKIQNSKLEEVKVYVEASKKKSDLERTDLAKEKTGVFTGLYCINPLNDEKVPIWIGDYVIGTYGGGAVMLVPAHDDRDFEFAKKYGLEIREVVVDGVLINFGEFTGLESAEACEKITSKLKELGVGEEVVNYHLRDWIFSRQHYWGEPIPMVFCEKCGWQVVDEKDLPITLPDVEKYEPTDTGESPLAEIEEWVQTTCPACGGKAKRETDTMPNWAGSDWYFLRYLDPNNTKALAGMEKMDYWMPVDVYIGGDEHNTLHLLYSRFIYQFLWDIGAVPKKVPEPYFKRWSHGVILGPDGHRMSKTVGNVIVPDEIVERYGVDSLRTYLMFMGPFTGTIAWNEASLRGVDRFLERFRGVITHHINAGKTHNIRVREANETPEFLSLLASTIKKVGEDIEECGFNTAIAALMELVNSIKKLTASSKLVISNNNLQSIVKLLAPFAPYLAEELWEDAGGKFSVHQQNWPKYDENALQANVVTIPVQVNGKLRATLKLAVSTAESKEQVEVLARQEKNVVKFLEDASVKKVIFVSGKLINFVVKK